MSNVRSTAQGCLVAACAHLSMMTVRNENFPTWVSVVRDVLPDCEGAVSAMSELKFAAQQLSDAKPGTAQGDAMTRLRLEVARYYEKAAAQRFDAWEQIKSKGTGQ